MEMIVFLIVFPLMVAALLFVVRQDAARNVIVYAGAGVIALASIAVALLNLGAPMTLIPFQSHAIDLICLGVSCVIAAIILAFAFKYRNVAAAVLAVVQILLALVFEFVFAPQVEVIYGLYLDSLSLLMALIIGVVGMGICVYALGYMKDFQAHEPSGFEGSPTDVLRHHVRVPLRHVRHRVLRQHGVDVHGVGSYHGLLVFAHRVH